MLRKKKYQCSNVAKSADAFKSNAKLDVFKFLYQIIFEDTNHIFHVQTFIRVILMKFMTRYGQYGDSNFNGHCKNKPRTPPCVCGYRVQFLQANRCSRLLISIKKRITHHLFKKLNFTLKGLKGLPDEEFSEVFGNVRNSFHKFSLRT